TERIAASWQRLGRDLHFTTSLPIWYEGSFEGDLLSFDTLQTICYEYIRDWDKARYMKIQKNVDRRTCGNPLSFENWNSARHLCTANPATTHKIEIHDDRGETCK